VIVVPAWVGCLDSSCLRELVAEALWARQYAVERGAEIDVTCRAVMKSADTTMEHIHDRRVTGDAACRKASAALRKYTTAAECALPTATRKRARAR